MRRARAGGDSAAGDALLALQKSYGNRHVQRILVQPKLLLGPVDDPYEREADRMADQVGARSREDGKSVDLPRRDAAIGSPPANPTAGAELEPEIETRISDSPGRPLPRAARTTMEQAFGADFRAVRIHAGPESELLNRSLGSAAFTAGRDVFLAKDSPDFSSPRAQKLLAHELTHVLQQTGGKRDLRPRAAVQRFVPEEELPFASAEVIPRVNKRIQIGDRPVELVLENVRAFPSVSDPDAWDSLAATVRLKKPGRFWSSTFSESEVTLRDIRSSDPAKPLEERDWQGLLEGLALEIQERATVAEPLLREATDLLASGGGEAQERAKEARRTATGGKKWAAAKVAGKGLLGGRAGAERALRAEAGARQAALAEVAAAGASAGARHLDRARMLLESAETVLASVDLASLLSQHEDFENVEVGTAEIRGWLKEGKMLVEFAPSSVKVRKSKRRWFRKRVAEEAGLQVSESERRAAFYARKLGKGEEITQGVEGIAEEEGLTAHLIRESQAVGKLELTSEGEVRLAVQEGKEVVQILRVETSPEFLARVKIDPGRLPFAKRQALKRGYGIRNRFYIDVRGQVTPDGWLLLDTLRAEVPADIAGPVDDPVAQIVEKVQTELETLRVVERPNDLLVLEPTRVESPRNPREARFLDLLPSEARGRLSLRVGGQMVIEKVLAEILAAAAQPGS